MITFTTERRALRELVPATYNPRKLTEKQHDDLKKSLQKFGLAEIPVINKDNTILAGHQRISVLASMDGLDTEIDVRVPNRQLNDKECKEYNIRSNKNTGGWDYDMLGNVFDMDDLLEWGFDEKELGGDEAVEEDMHKPTKLVVEFSDRDSAEELYERLLVEGHVCKIQK